MPTHEQASVCISTINDTTGTEDQHLLDDGYQRFKPPKPIDVNAVADTRTVLGTADQVGLFQDPEVLGDGGLRKRKFVNNLAAFPRFLAGQHPQYPYARWVADRFRKPGEFLIGFRTLQRLQIQLGISGLWWAMKFIIG